MKKSKITIEIDLEKLEAVSTFISDKDTTIEKELEDTFQKLYEKHVPAPVRIFIERNKERTRFKNKKNDKSFQKESITQ